MGPAYVQRVGVTVGSGGWLWPKSHLAWPLCKVKASSQLLSVSLAVPLPDVGRHFELERSFVRSIKPSNYVLSGLELAHGRPDLPPTIHLSTLRPGRLASCLQGLGYPLACRPARFALRGAGFVLTAVAAAVLIARLAIDTMMRAIASQLHISDAYGHTASVATIAAVLALLVGVVLLLWARLAE